MFVSYMVYEHGDGTTNLSEVAQLIGICLAIIAIDNLNDGLDLILPTFDSFPRLHCLGSKPFDHNGRQAVSERLEVALLICWYHLLL